MVSRSSTKFYRFSTWPELFGCETSMTVKIFNNVAGIKTVNIKFRVKLLLIRSYHGNTGTGDGFFQVIQGVPFLVYIHIPWKWFSLNLPLTTSRFPLPSLELVLDTSCVRYASGMPFLRYFLHFHTPRTFLRPSCFILNLRIYVV